MPFNSKFRVVYGRDIDLKKVTQTSKREEPLAEVGISRITFPLVL